MSLFTTIKNAVIRQLNEEDITGIEDKTIVLKCKYYPSTVLNWFYKTGAFKIGKVSKEKADYGYKYYITIKDVDPECELFKNTGLRTRLTKDEYDPIQFQYYSTGLTNYEAYNSPNKVRIDFRDMTCSDKIVCDLGYDNYDQMVEEMGQYYADDLGNQKARDFENNEKAPEWTYSSEYEDSDV